MLAVTQAEKFVEYAAVEIEEKKPPGSSWGFPVLSRDQIEDQIKTEGYERLNEIQEKVMIEEVSTSFITISRMYSIPMTGSILCRCFQRNTGVYWVEASHRTSYRQIILAHEYLPPQIEF